MDGLETALFIYYDWLMASGLTFTFIIERSYH